jgi:integrase
VSGSKLEGGRNGTGLTPAGAADLEWRLCSHLLPAFAAQRLDEITVEDVDRYRRAKVQEAERRRNAIENGQPHRDRSGRLLRPLSATSISKTLTTLAAILEVAFEYELMHRNAAKGRRRRLPAATPHRSYIDRADHVAALLDAAARLDATAISRRGQRRALLATLVFAGLRISEALSLRWLGVDLARGEIVVRKSKTDAGIRKVRVLPVLRDELLALRARLHDPAPSALVCPTSTGKRQSVSNIRSRVLLKAIAEANAVLATAGDEPLPEGLTPHSLRRTFASLRFAIGEPPPRVMKQMGHTIRTSRWPSTPARWTAGTGNRNG